MFKKYLIKYAWQCTHDVLGEIVCFVATPYTPTSPCANGYVLTANKDEVFRMGADSKTAKMILRKLTNVGNHQWCHPNCNYLVEMEFNMDTFFDQEIFQESSNYNREVLFHTDCDLL